MTSISEHRKKKCEEKGAEGGGGDGANSDEWKISPIYYSILHVCIIQYIPVCRTELNEKYGREYEDGEGKTYLNYFL